MSLKSRFAPQFNPKIRDRGLAYFRGGAVKILEYSDLHVLAQVKGTQNYFVELRLTSHSLNVACTCPYFYDGEDCKHIWATMLAADSKNYLADVDSHGPLRLLYDEVAVEALQLLEQDRVLKCNLKKTGCSTTTPGPIFTGGKSNSSSCARSPPRCIRPSFPGDQERSMIGYVTLGTNDIDRAGKFYDSLLGTIGAKRWMSSDSFIAWTGPDGEVTAVIWARAGSERLTRARMQSSKRNFIAADA